MEDDYEISDYYCPRCGQNLMRRDCEECGGEGTIDDLYEQDPLWYDESDWEHCSNCEGVGAFFWCKNKECKVTRKEIKKAMAKQDKEEREI